MPRRYSAEVRRQVCARLLAGEAVKDLCVELGICDHTLYRWRRQARPDAGAGLGGVPDPLTQARRRVKELEAELRLVKAASALFEEGTVSPKGNTRLSED